MPSPNKFCFFDNYFRVIFDRTSTVDSESLIEASEIVRDTPPASKIIICGNGGSAAISSHVAVDFTKAAGIRAVNFNEADLITCYSNDYGYENWISKALESYSLKEDLVILISSSGKSPNIINAAHYCRDKCIKLITFSGFDHDNPLRKLGNVNLWVNSTEYNIVEMTHHIWLLAIVDYIVAHKDQQG